MSLIMLLMFISGITPIALGIEEGNKHGIIGAIIGAFIGAIIGVVGFMGIHYASIRVINKIMPMVRPLFASCIAALWYILIIAWAFVTGGASMAVVKTIPWK